MLGFTGILIGKTDFLVNVVIGRIIHTLEAGEAVDGVIIESVFEIERSQQFKHMRITGDLCQRNAVSHVKPGIIHYSDKFTSAGKQLEEPIQILNESINDAHAFFAFIG